MSTTETLTLDQQIAEAIQNNQLFEIVDGMVVAEGKSMGANTGGVGFFLAFFLDTFALPKNLGIAYSEILIDLGEGRSQRRPDAIFVDAKRFAVNPLEPAKDVSAWRIIPNLAAEVVSKTNSADEIEGKILEYFEAGIQVVWVVHPKTNRVYVYDSPTTVKILGLNDELSGGSFLPGFQLKIADLFAVMKLK